MNTVSENLGSLPLEEIQGEVPRKLWSHFVNQSLHYIVLCVFLFKIPYLLYIVDSVLMNSCS